jgi:hypothetical protein
MDMRTVELVRHRLPREVRDIIYSYLWEDVIKEKKKQMDPNGRYNKLDLSELPPYTLKEQRDWQGSLTWPVPFSWSNLGFILAGEAAEWAYENIDAAELVHAFMGAHGGLDLHHVRRYLQHGIFDVHGKVPGELAIPRMTVAIHCDSYV